MNGIHDMGGLHGFGAVEVERDEPVFHARWEGRVFCMTQILDTTGIWSLDEHRHEIERLDAADYLAVGYYGRWLLAMERLLERKNILRGEEVRRRIEEYLDDACGTVPLEPHTRNWPLPNAMKIRWGAWRKEVEVMPRYNVGQRVRVRNLHPEGHTRVTAYTRGKTGTIAIVNAQGWVFPDTRAHYRGEKPQPVYNVRFDAYELWGPQAESNVFTQIDLSEDHLEPVDGEPV
ncbi:nitrile hydratase subunit beta [Paraburkholderia fynbosensis]|uniref:Nitrile hydratase subunit beta n=1 Tax=Paraburkholderia fynbosensis TaxID=1200993 RepID=A0A6J5GW46_9BURK|nr:nitrile hydratase subunit beta [Paraburkholderia fynbosensis]CAB3807345.1 Low-molecular weight cobalt-containing nitrile hydratase subunit beta [Paraburkholderia fynbosensis]